MEISVVIPTYKRPDLLLQCLRCLEKQTFPLYKFEAVVVSDGYDPGTKNAVMRYMNHSKLKIRYLYNKVQSGPAAARNLGWKNSESPLIAFTDDDCLPDPNWLLSFAAAYRGEKKAAFTGFTSVPVPEEPTDFALNTSHLQIAEFITANCACTRDTLIEVDGFDENFKTAWREDSDLEFRLIQANISVINVKGAKVIHPVRKNVPWGVSIREQKKSLYDALLYKKHPELYRSKIQPQPMWNYYGIIISSFVMLISLLLLSFTLAALSGMVLILLVTSFFFKRIRFASKAPSHIAEMLFTSFLIPFVSVFWHLYGAVKYRVFFL